MQTNSYDTIVGYFDKFDIAAVGLNRRANPLDNIVHAIVHACDWFGCLALITHKRCALTRMQSLPSPACLQIW